MENCSNHRTAKIGRYVGACLGQSGMCFTLRFLALSSYLFKVAGGQVVKVLYYKNLLLFTRQLEDITC